MFIGHSLIYMSSPTSHNVGNSGTGVVAKFRNWVSIMKLSLYSNENSSSRMSILHTKKREYFWNSEKRKKRKKNKKCNPNGNLRTLISVYSDLSMKDSYGQSQTFSLLLLMFFGILNRRLRGVRLEKNDTINVTNGYTNIVLLFISRMKYRDRF